MLCHASFQCGQEQLNTGHCLTTACAAAFSCSEQVRVFCIFVFICVSCNIVLLWKCAVTTNAVLTGDETF